jgi:hypothetical protein
MDLRKQDYHASLQSILVRVSVRRFSTDSNVCPAIRTQMSALSKLNVSLQDASASTIILDATTHQISISISLGRVDATIYDDNHPLVRWANATYDALLACSVSR